MSEVLPVKVAHCQLQIQRIFRKFWKAHQVGINYTQTWSNLFKSLSLPLSSPDFHQKLVTDTFELDVVDEEHLATMVTLTH